MQNYNYIKLIEQTVYYNVRKKFGQCSISLAKFKNYEDFKQNFHLEAWDAVSILKGKILDEQKRIILDVGDTIDLEQIKSFQKIQIEDEIEIIIIKKKDTMVKLSDYVASFLEKEKINDIFVVPGSANVHLLDSVGKNNNLTHICTQTEQVAAMAAESYAKLTGKIGVAMISSGCCSTNALTGVADAWVDSTPLLIISGQSQSDQTVEDVDVRQIGVQEIDIINMVKPITKYAVKIKDPHSIRYHLEKALFLSQNSRPGPVWIDLPIDIQGMTIDEEELIAFEPASAQTINYHSNQEILSSKVSEVLHLLKKAQRPVILAGMGIRIAGAEQKFMDLIEQLQLPVLTTKRGADLLFEDHPLYFGRPGAYGQRSANFIIQNCDVLLSIGARLSLPLIGRNYKAFARGARKIVVDIDPLELKKITITPDIAISCDTFQFCTEMLHYKDQYAKPDISVWMQRCAEWKTKYASEPHHFVADTVSAYLVMHTLSQELPAASILTIDGGSSIVFAMHQFKFKTGQRLISSTGLDNMSFGLPAAIGACIGNKGKTVYCICEDRGFQKNLQELETIIQYHLPIKIIILNHR